MNRVPRYQEYIEPPNLAMPRADGRFHLYETSAGVVDPHYHPLVEFSFVVDGSGEEIVNGRAHQVAPGSATLRLPHQIHSFRADSEHRVRKYGCMFDMNTVVGTADDTIWCARLYQVGTRYESSVMLDSVSQRLVRGAFDVMRSEQRGPILFGRHHMLRSGLVQALTVFLRAIDSSDAADSTADPRRASAYGALLHHVHMNYTSPVSLGTVAKAAGVSTSYASRLFKEESGQNFVGYVHQLRVRSAAAMLVSSEMSVSDIAVAAGFESFRTFARVFREITGQTPATYRAARRN